MYFKNRALNQIIIDSYNGWMSQVWVSHNSLLEPEIEPYRSARYLSFGCGRIHDLAYTETQMVDHTKDTFFYIKELCKALDEQVDYLIILQKPKQDLAFIESQLALILDTFPEEIRSVEEIQNLKEEARNVNETIRRRFEEKYVE